jgi:integrase
MSVSISELVKLYQQHTDRESVKHGRYTSSKYRHRSATNYLIEVVVRGDAIDGRPVTRSAAPPEDLPQLDLLASDLPGQGGEPVRALADLRVDQLDRRDMQDYLDHLLTKTNRRGQPWTAAHVNKCRETVLKMFEWAEGEGIVPSSLRDELKRCKRIKSAKTVARRSKRVTPAPAELVGELIAAMRARAKTLPTRTKPQRRRRRDLLLAVIALELTWEVGMRPIETVVMRPIDVVEVQGEAGAWEYRPSEWKTEGTADDDGEVRIVPLTERAKALFDEAVGLKTADGDQSLLTFSVEYDPAERLFPWKAKHPYDARGAFTGRIVKELEAAGLAKMSTRQLRHAFITRAAEIDVRLAQVWAGHKNIQTTMNYVHGEAKARRRLAAELDAAARGGPPPSGPGPAPRRTGTDDREDPPPLRLVGGW